MNRIDLPYVSDVREIEFPAEVLQQVILNNKHECLTIASNVRIL